MASLDFVSLTLQAVASVVTLWAIWEMGNKRLRGPALSLASDAAFLTLNIYQQLWVLLPFCLLLLCIHIRNFRKWRTDG